MHPRPSTPRPRCLAGLFVLLALSCATEPAPLDRTQPEALNKAMFLGEWNYKMTVTDTEWENAVTFIGEETSSYTGAAFKVRWEITQDLLTAYRIPQRYRDPAGKLVENPIGQKTPILAFKIKKHYDIRYRYNSTTREDLNVIEENTDRPWNEREYMELDWSQSLVTNVANPTIEGLITGELLREPVSVQQNVEFFSRGATPDLDTRIDTRKWNPAKDPEVYVMNIDTKEAITTRLESWIDLYYGHYMEPVSVRYRHSLMRAAPIDDKATYKPLQYTDDVFRRFGYFRTEYEVYDPERGPLENQKQYLANRWDFSGSKKLVWYASPSFQEQIDAGDTELKGYALKVIEEWNRVFKEATGRTDDPMIFAENARLKDADGKPVLDAEGKPRWTRELGDLRWSFLNFTTKPQAEAPLGYGPSTPDADTGEIVNGTVNVYGDWLDYVIRRTMDQYDVAAGNCSLDQVKDGFFFDPKTGKCDSGVWVGQPHGGVVPQKSALTAGEPVRLYSLTPTLKTAWWPKADIRKPDRPIPPETLEKARAKAREAFEWRRKHPPTLDTKVFGVVAGTKYETMLVPQANLHSLVPHAPSADDPAVVSLLSPANRLAPDALRAMRAEQIRRSTHYDDPVAFEPAIHAFVADMKGKPRDEVYRTLRTWVWYTATLHEMGHTLGLRHNFRGSVDRPNFPAQFEVEYKKYWDAIYSLRSKYGAGIAAGDPDAYEAYVQAVDDIPSVHQRWASSSIMDYMGDWEQWFYPVGSWDRAAILFAYGNKIEVKEDGATDWKVVPYQDGDFRIADPFDAAAKAESGRKVRYYLFCSDEKLFDDMFCTHFDSGTTATEITRNFIRDAQPSYFFKNFKRQSTLFDGRYESYYINKWLWTYYMHAKPLPEMELASMRYDRMWDAIWDGIDAIAKGPEARDMKPGYHQDGGEDLLRASLLIYYYMLYDVLGRPDYGFYQPAWDTAGKQYWDSTEERYLDEELPAANVPAGLGWGWDDRWDAQDDFGQYYAHLTRIGVEIDKVIALEILSIPAVLNDPLTMEKANGLSYWNSLWTNDGSQLWEIIRGLITDNFSHRQNPWCIACDAKCKADPKAHPPEVKAYPIDLLEGVRTGGLVDSEPVETLGTRCGEDEQPMRPGMDALFAIQPIFYGIAGASHPWYQNGLQDRMDSQVVGGNHQFEPAKGAPTAKFVNSSGTKTYLAAQTSDGLGISYRLVQNGARIRNRIDMVAACDAEEEPPPEVAAAVHRTCEEVLDCYYCPAGQPDCTTPDYCDTEGWDWSYLYSGFKWRDLDRIEAMLIMMQDMVDLAGHQQWIAPDYDGP